MGKLAELLKTTQAAPHTPASVPEPETHATSIEGTHNNSDYDAILTTCGHDPARVTFATPPAVNTRWKLDGTQVTSYRYKLIEKPTQPLQQAYTEWRELLKNQPTPTPVDFTDTYPTTYVVIIADPQLGKKGTQQAVANWKRGINGHHEAISVLKAAGTSPERIHIAWMGDETEGVCNNYENQPHTVELNMSQQLELDFDLRVWTLKTLAELGIPMSASSVISNHGEWTRNGGKDPVTTHNDNSSTHNARLVKKLFDETVVFGGPYIEWTIGDGDPGLIVELSGKKCYFSHGYIEKGRGTSTETRTRGAIERQILGNTDTLGDVPIWIMAHYHHFYTNEFEGRTLFGCPALEAERSSEYMLHQYGVWSPAGMLGMLIGHHATRGWSNLNIF